MLELNVVTANVYAIRDAKTGSFAAPFIQPNHGTAIRAFGDLCRDQQALIARHPEDYALFHVGEFNQRTGALIPLEQPLSISVALEFTVQPGQLKAVE